MNWNELNEPWRKAFLLGWESFCNGSIPIGAVITDKDDKIISYGRNKINEGTIPNFKTAHAEIEAAKLATDFFSEGYLDKFNSDNVPFSKIFDNICKKL